MTSKQLLSWVAVVILYFVVGYLCGQESQRRADEKALMQIDSLQAHPVVHHKDGRIWT